MDSNRASRLAQSTGVQLLSCLQSRVPIRYQHGGHLVLRVYDMDATIVRSSIYKDSRSANHGLGREIADTTGSKAGPMSL